MEASYLEIFTPLTRSNLSNTQLVKSDENSINLERVWAPNNPYHARQAASKKAENGLFEDAFFAQRSNAKFTTYPPHLWGLDTRITATHPPND